MIARWHRWNLAHPWHVIVAVLCLTLAALSGLQGFQPNNDPRIFFTEDNPDYKRLVLLEERFTPSESLLFVVNPASGNLFEREVLDALVHLTDAAWTLPYAARVDSVTNYQHTRVDGDVLTVGPLVEHPLQYTDAQVQRLRDVAVTIPFLRHSLISPEGHVAGVLVTVAMEDGHANASEVTLAAMRLAKEFEQRYPFLDIMLTGTVVFSHASEVATRQTMSQTLPLALLAMVVLLQILLRSVLFTTLVMLVVAVSVGVSTGLAVHMGIVFSPIVGMAPAMVLTLAVADCVHLLGNYRFQRLQGQGVDAAMLSSLRVNMLPIWLTSLTTAIGFAVLNFSESQPFRALGNVVILGVFAAFVFSVVLLPALVKVVPHRIEASSQWHYDPWMMRFSAWVVRYHKRLLVIMACVVTALSASLFLNRINDVFSEYFDDTFEIRQANDFYARELSGMHRLDYALDAGGDYATMTPAYLRDMDRFVSWLREQEHVVYAVSFSDIIKQIHRDMHQGDEAFYRIPDSSELISQYTLLLEMSLPQGLGLEFILDASRRYSRVVVVLENIGSSPLQAFDQKVYQWMQVHLPQQMQSRGTGTDLLFATVTVNNITQLLQGGLIALVCVSVLLLAGLRSVRYGLISLFPNVFPALVAFGIWGWLVGQVGLTVSVMACMTLGIVVDDTIHFLTQYVRARREQGMDTAAAITHAFRSVGVAIVVTTVVLATNFAIIGTSHFQPSAQLGQLAAWTILMALVVDFLFFVPLLIWLDTRQARAGGQGHPASTAGGHNGTFVSERIVE